MKILSEAEINELAARCEGHTPGDWFATYSGLNLGEPDQEITNYGIHQQECGCMDWFLEASNDTFDFDESTWPTMQLAAAAPSLLDTCQDLIRREKVLVEALEAWMTWDYEVQSAKVDGESVYSFDDFQRMRFEATRKGQAVLAQVQDGGGK